MTSQWVFNATTVWFLIGLFCVIGEFILPGVIIVFFGVGAWTAALVCYFFNISVTFQVAIFTITSIAALITLRRRFNPSPEDLGPDLTEEFAGKTAIVEEPVSKGKPGRVIFKGALWKAETFSGDMLEKGRYVRIVKKESIILFVEPINPEEVQHV